MQDEQVSGYANQEQALRTQNLIWHLEKLWQPSQQPSSEVIKRVIQFLAQLSEPYQGLGMTKIAEYLASGMGIHFLDLLAIFRENAKNEGIDREEYVQTLEDVLTELFPEMMGISKQVFVRSLDDLITLSNITFSLRTLSHVDTAEEAQSWMYELPSIYERQLAQEQLITTIQVQWTI